MKEVKKTAKRDQFAEGGAIYRRKINYFGYFKRAFAGGDFGLI